jgi:hypothetical protein
MTARQLFEYSLIELNKVQAPSLILEDYNYFINKAVNQYINKTYNLYDVNQQKSDDIRVLKSTAILTPTSSTDLATSALYNKTYNVTLPDDYLHILNCIVEYTTTKQFKCYNASEKVHFGAKRLTADMFSQIINNYYMRPSYKNPYFYINNVNTKNTYPTEDNQTDVNYTVDGTPQNIDKVSENRYGNKSKVLMEIRYGKDDTLFQLSKVYVDYLKAPQFIRLTQAQVDEVEDKSQILEFPDYVCQEITNELIKLLMENGSDPRLQSHIPINQSIANPAQEQPQR